CCGSNFRWYAGLMYRHSMPTRRSSDLENFCQGQNWLPLVVVSSTPASLKLIPNSFAKVWDFLYIVEGSILQITSISKNHKAEKIKKDIADIRSEERRVGRDGRGCGARVD